jgi:putative tryptophan/tyrosine transport system substrate-binding protein
MQLIGLAVVLAVSLTLGSPSVEAQTEKVWRIGLMHVGLDHVPPSLAPLREELRTLGYEDGRNIRLDFRNLADEATANTTARQFVRDQVDLIVAFEEQAMRAVVAATSTLPIVFLHLVDPVADGFVKSPPRWKRDRVRYLGRLTLEADRVVLGVPAASASADGAPRPQGRHYPTPIT